MIGSAHFRFLKLTKEQASLLEETNLDVKITKHYESDKYVGSFELTDTSVVIAANEFKKKISAVASDCDVFISIVSDKRDEVWRAPKLVNYVVNIVNCPIVFSYTC